MKRFQFRLESLLKYQRQRMRQAEIALQQAAAQRDAAQAERDRIWQELVRAGRNESQPGELLNPARREQMLHFIEQLERNLQQREEFLKSAELRFREAQENRTAVMQEVEALLHLRKQAWQAFVDQSAKRLQAELDDVVMRQWARRGRAELSIARMIK